MDPAPRRAARSEPGDGPDRRQSGRDCGAHPESRRDPTRRAALLHLHRRRAERQDIGRSYLVLSSRYIRRFGDSAHGCFRRYRTALRRSGKFFIPVARTRGGGQMARNAERRGGRGIGQDPSVSRFGLPVAPFPLRGQCETRGNAGRHAAVLEYPAPRRRLCGAGTTGGASARDRTR